MPQRDLLDHHGLGVELPHFAQAGSHNLEPLPQMAKAEIKMTQICQF